MSGSKSYLWQILSKCNQVNAANEKSMNADLCCRNVDCGFFIEFFGRFEFHWYVCLMDGYRFKCVRAMVRHDGVIGSILTFLQFCCIHQSHNPLFDHQTLMHGMVGMVYRVIHTYVHRSY